MCICVLGTELDGARFGHKLTKCFEREKVNVTSMRQCGYSFVFVQHVGLDTLEGCMPIHMTVGGKDCHPSVLKNEVTCRIPEGLDFSPDGFLAQVELVAFLFDFYRFHSVVSSLPSLADVSLYSLFLTLASLSHSVCVLSHTFLIIGGYSFLLVAAEENESLAYQELAPC